MTCRKINDGFVSLWIYYMHEGEFDKNEMPSNKIIDDIFHIYYTTFDTKSQEDKLYISIKIRDFLFTPTYLQCIGDVFTFKNLLIDIYYFI